MHRSIQNPLEKKIFFLVQILQKKKTRRSKVQIEAFLNLCSKFIFNIVNNVSMDLMDVKLMKYCQLQLQL